METDALRLIYLLFLTFSSTCFALESFRITVQDRKVKIEAPKDKSKIYSVIVENKSLSDVIGKFHSNNQDLKFVSIKSSASKSVEFSHQSGHKVHFKILSPAFQELVLEAGKKSYEVPSVQ